MAKQGARIARDAHVLDEHAKSLHTSIHQSHQEAKQFHENARLSKWQTERNETHLQSGSGLTEQDLKDSADEQLHQMAMTGSRAAHSKNKKSA